MRDLLLFTGGAVAGGVVGAVFALAVLPRLERAIRQRRRHAPYNGRSF